MCQVVVWRLTQALREQEVFRTCRPSVLSSVSYLFLQLIFLFIFFMFSLVVATLANRNM
jgi:hypothetical protein